jgi:hypothetical protein
MSQDAAYIEILLKDATPANELRIGLQDALG